MGPEIWINKSGYEDNDCIILIYLTTGRESFISRNGPLSTYRICHNKFEHLPQIDFRIIVAPVLHWKIKRGTSLEYIYIYTFLFFFFSKIRRVFSHISSGKRRTQ